MSLNDLVKDMYLAVTQDGKLAISWDYLPDEVFEISSQESLEIAMLVISNTEETLAPPAKAIMGTPGGELH